MDTTPRRGKRGRSDSLSSSSSASSTTSQASSSCSLSPVNKILRSTSVSGEIIECNLPPTCFPTSQKFETISELERHQLAFHTYICRTPVRDKTEGLSGAGQNDPSAVPREFTSRKRNDWRECRKVFPDQRILDLHQAETHDPSRLRQHGGVPIVSYARLWSEGFEADKPVQMLRPTSGMYQDIPESQTTSPPPDRQTQITEQDGLGASLIRPVKYFEPPAESTSPSTPVVDVDMDDLTKSMKSLESSLSIVPAQLRRKGKGNGKAGPAKVLEAGIGD